MDVFANVIKCLRDGTKSASPTLRMDMYVEKWFEETDIELVYIIASELADVVTYPLVFIRDVMDGLSGCRKIGREIHPEVAWKRGYRPAPDPTKPFRVSLSVAEE